MCAPLQLVGVLLVALFSELIPDVPVPVEVQVCQPFMYGLRVTIAHMTAWVEGRGRGRDRGQGRSRCATNIQEISAAQRTSSCWLHTHDMLITLRLSDAARTQPLLAEEGDRAGAGGAGEQSQWHVSGAQWTRWQIRDFPTAIHGAQALH